MVARPLASTASPAIVVAYGSASGPCSAIASDATTFRLPAPAPIRPASGRNVAPSCSASFTGNGFRPGLASSSSATAPVTTAVDMLVPLNTK